MVISSTASDIYLAGHEGRKKKIEAKRKIIASVVDKYSKDGLTCGSGPEHRGHVQEFQVEVVLSPSTCPISSTALLGG